MRIAELLLGTVLVLIAFFDVFATVLVPRTGSRGFRIGPALVRALAPLWRHGASRLRTSRVRQNLRASLGPAILVAALAWWVLMLSLGFALMLHSQPQYVSLDHFSFGEAWFQATLAISTLGIIHADILGPARGVVAVAGISGFTVLTLTVAFLLSIQEALHRRETQVMTLPGRAGRPPSAVTLLDRHAGAGDDELASLFASWEEWAAELLQSHLSQPVLFRFRSLDEDAEWLSCLGTMLDAAALVRAAEPAGYPRSVRAAAFLATTGGRAVHEFSRLLRIPKGPPERDQGVSTDLCERLVRNGFPPAHPARLTERLRTLRADHAARLPQLADRLDIALPDTLLGEAKL